MPPSLTRDQARALDARATRDFGVPGLVQEGPDRGVAMSALKHSIPGDFARVTRDEVEAMLQGGGLRISR